MIQPFGDGRLLRVFDPHALEPDSGGVRPRSDGLSARSTLSQFYFTFFRPVWLAEAEPQTAERYDHTLVYWTRYWVKRNHPEPSLECIDEPGLTAFVAWLRGQRFHGKTIRPKTVFVHVRNLRRILKTCGPKLPYASEQLNQRLLAEVPWVQCKRPDDEPPAKDYTLAEVQRLLAACAAMRTPRDVPGVAPADWWRTYLLVTCETGFRIGTMLRLEWRFIDPEGWVQIPPESSGKSRKRVTHYLRPRVREALERIHTRRRLVFPWYQYPELPGSKSHFYHQFKRLLRLAGMPVDRHFGTHGFRKYHATQLVGSDPTRGIEDAARSLHHSRTDLVRQHYANAGVLSEAERRQIRASVERLPELHES